MRKRKVTQNATVVRDLPVVMLTAIKRMKRNDL